MNKTNYWFEKNYRDGNDLREKRDFNSAIKCLKEALKVIPNSAEVHYSLGVTYKIKGDLEAAIISFQTVLKLKPDFLEAYNCLGVIFKIKGDLNAAMTCFKKVLELEPKSAQAHYNLGLILKTKGELKDAINSYQNAINLNPDHQNAHNNLGNIFQEMGAHNASIQCFQKALKLNPNFAEAHYNLGNTFRELGDINSSINCYKKALRIKSDFELAYYNLGVSLKTKGELKSAINSYQKTIKLNRNNIAAHYNLGQAIFLIGNDYQKAWLNYEYRFKKTEAPVIPHANPPIPKWRGENFNSQDKLLVVTEQGLGDTMQFMRYIPYLLKQGIKVSFCAQTKLHDLIKNSNIISEPLTPEKGNEINEGKWISLLSVPKILNVTKNNNNIYGTKPYIFSSSDQRNEWREILSKERKPILGINWQGNPKTELLNLKDRSFPLEIFSSIAKNYDCKFLSLQKGFGSEQLETCSFRDQFVQCQEQVNKTWGFLETAAIISNCDLVITSDTSVAHLSAGMGKLTWCLLHFVPDWRWGIEGETTFWYPSMKLFRQKKPNNWAEVIEKVVLELKSILPTK